MKSVKTEKDPKRQNFTKQELRRGKTCDSDMLHFCTFAFVLGFLPALAFHGCGFVKFATVTFGIFATLASAHFRVAENILANFVIFAA